MLIGNRVQASAIPASKRGSRGSKFAEVVEAALKLGEGEALPISFDEKDGKYPTNNLVYSIRKGSYKDMGLDARSVTTAEGKTVFITKKAVEAEA